MYTGILSVLLSISSLEVITKKFSDKLFNVIFLVITGVLVFRYGQGPDYVVYEFEYNNILLQEDVIGFILFKGDYLFWSLVAICNYVNLPFEVFVGLIAVFSMYCLYKFIILHSNYRFISLFIFFCLYYVYFDTLLRQSIALAIVIYYVYSCLIKKQYVKGFLFIILASLFHQSALVVILGLILIKLKYLNNTIVISVSFLFLLLNFTGFVDVILNIAPSFLQQRMEWYSQGNINILGLMNRGMMYSIILILVIVNKRLGTLDEKQAFLMKFYSLFMLVYCIFAKMDLIASRLDIYFRILEIIILPNLLVVFKSMNFRKIIFITFTLAVFINIYSGINYYKNIKMYLYQGNYYQQNIFEYPYISIFNKDEINEKSDYSYHNIVNK